jgi:outer membrane protein OmpA-like peptidoglycan-associated protein
METSASTRNKIRIQSKRNVELWIYSFADMYMILSVFFIALSVIYAAKVKEDHKNAQVASAGRGTASVSTELELEFSRGSAEIESSVAEDLALLLPAAKSLKKGFVEIEGYADSTPLKADSGFSSNLDLSNRRAVRVAEWLIKNGVAAGRIRTFSYGDGRTWGPNEAPSNRRVVVKLASYGGG